MTVPKMMKTAVLHAYNQPLTVEEQPIPQPGPGEVLIRMAHAPINPSDLSSLEGRYANPKPLPNTPGMEGSGTVVAAGSGLLPRLWMGRRVACVAPASTAGTWAEYMVTKAQVCAPLNANVTLKQGAMMFVNPLSAWAMMDMALSEKHRAVVSTAAASALGRMMLRLGQRMNLPMIHVVRRQEQVDLLQDMGAEHVLNSSEPDYESRLKACCHDLGATLAFDAIAGSTTFQLAEVLPRGGKVVVYGGLSQEPSKVDPRKLIFEQKVVSGFWLSAWQRDTSLFKALRTVNKVQKLLGSDLKTAVSTHIPLIDINHGVQHYRNNMTEGKVLLQLGEENN
jgi:NADPH2:quinone reductase